MSAHQSMMPSPIAYSCTALMGINKVGELKCSEDGYYTVVLGALNYNNSSGAHYPYSQSAKALFDASSMFIRRVNSGALRGEYGHPRPQPGQPITAFMSRCADIHEQSVSHHIRKVWLSEDTVKGPDGRPCLAILGEVKPCGPYGDALRRSLENPSENVCFSIRSFTEDKYVGGVLHKNLVNIITWDLVNEPGINVATKWKSPALESICEQDVSVMQLRSAINNALAEGVSLESNLMSVLNETVAALESAQPKQSEQKTSRLVRPPSASW